MIRHGAWPTTVLATWLPLLGVLAVLTFALPLSPAWDLTVFLHAGRALLHGLPVYPRPGTPAVFSGFSFVYPYFAAWLFVPFAALPGSVAVPWFIAISAGSVLAAGMVAAGASVSAVALVLGSSFVVTGLQLGAVSPLLLAGALWMWRPRDRPLAFALLAALVAGSKLFLIPLLLWPLAARRGRAFALSVAMLALVLGVGFVLGPVGPGAYDGAVKLSGLWVAVVLMIVWRVAVPPATPAPHATPRVRHG